MAGDDASPARKAIRRYLVEVEGLQQRRYKVTIEGSFRYYANQNGEAEEAATRRALELLIELREELEHEFDQWVRLTSAPPQTLRAGSPLRARHLWRQI